MASTTIQTILDLIRTGADPLAYLQQLPVGQIPRESMEVLIIHLLSAAYTVQNTLATRSILSSFNDARGHIDSLPAITYLFLNPKITRELLLFVVAAVPEKEPLSYYIDLVNLHDDTQSLRVLATMETVFPKLSNADWRLLFRLTESEDEEEEYPNAVLREYFRSKAAETGTEISPPPWMRSLPEQPIPPIPDYIPSVHDAVTLLLEDMKSKLVATTPDQESIDLEQELEIRETLIAQYAISTLSEKIKMLQHVQPLPDFDSTVLFQEYGPINTMYSLSAHHDPDHICAKYGGCLMWQCTEFEEMNEYGDALDLMTIEEHLEDLDWFRGSCDLCQTKIPYREYALRQPLEHGGWKGCYCLDCVDKVVPTQLTGIMLARVKEQLRTIGIRAR